MFARPEDSHTHSLTVLNMLYEYDDFMASIRTMADLGCGHGLDLEWWATRTTREDRPRPLNIKCVGIDIVDQVAVAKKHPNATYQRADFESEIIPPSNKFDVLWCHDSFQFATDPIRTLSHWWHITSPGGMLAISVPQTIGISERRLYVEQPLGCYYHYTMVNLIHMLALSGWDCAGGFFQQKINDPWIHAVVYKSSHAPMNPKSTNWHILSEKGLLPESVSRSAFAHNAVRYQDLVLPWLDHSITWYGKQ